MEIILLSIACILNASAIILHLVSHFRGNRRKGTGVTYSDIKRATEIQRFMEKANESADNHLPPVESMWRVDLKNGVHDKNWTLYD